MQRARRFAVLSLLAMLLAACGGSMSQSTSVSPVDVARSRQPQQQPSVPQESQKLIEAPQEQALAPTQDSLNMAIPAPDAQMPADGATSSELRAPAQDVQVLPTPLPIDPEPIAPEGSDSMYFQNYGVNPFIATSNDPLSTFAMDVDTASYTLMREYIKRGQLPDPDSVRVEEYLNYFNYDYPQPEQGDFAIYTEAAPSPFGGPGYQLVQIGIQGRSIASAERKPAALTFVIDVSGSMAREDRLGAVQSALITLVDQMRPDDSIAIAVYGSNARAVLDVTSGDQKAAIQQAINGLMSEGSTNVEAGLRVGFGLADEAYKPDGINMIILCSDGVANNGVTDPQALLDAYQPYLERGIQLSTYGFGMGNYNDILLEQLADGGDGAYAYIDSASEAQRVFVENLTGTLQTIARDAKIQVAFDPANVAHYRLIGYENRDVADVDFRNDSVDAGEVGAGHSVTALYEIKLQPNASGPLLTTRIRYQPADGGDVIESSSTFGSADAQPDVAKTTPRFKLAASVAQYAELLRHSQWSRAKSIEDVISLALSGAAGYPDDINVAEFVTLVQQAAALAQ